MQRDWDIVRKILLKVEANPTTNGEVGSSDIEGVPPAVAAHHMVLLSEAGLIEGGGRPNGVVGAEPWRYATRLTWDGHDLLDKIRRDTVWNRIKTIARDKGIDLTVDAIKAIARVVLDELLR